MLRRRKLLMGIATAALAFVAADVLVVYPCLRYSGFHATSAGGVKEDLRDEMPNNIVSNERYIWSYIPHSHYTQESTTTNASIHVRINSHGFRGEEPATQCRAEFPFVALGDSFTFGWEVDEQARWDVRLAGLLTQRAGVKAASINLGMWLSTFDQHALVLEDNWPQGAKAVIHFVYPSHVQTIQRHRDQVVQDRIVACWDPLLHVKGQQLYYGAADDAVVAKELSFPFLLSWIRYERNRSRLQEMMSQGPEPLAALDDKLIYQADQQSRFAVGWRLTEMAIRQAAGFCRTRGVPYVMVIVPRDLQLSAEEWNGKRPLPEILSGHYPQARLQRLCADIPGAHCLDLLPIMRKRYSGTLYYQRDRHWRPEGHKLAAEAVCEYLQNEGLVGPAAGH